MLAAQPVQDALDARAIAARQKIMRICAQASEAELTAALDALEPRPEAVDVRPPETGLVMLRGRIGGSGAPFNVGEATVTRAVVRLGTGETGFPGYQVPFASREMPMPYGWGTGGVQVTAAVLGADDTLKVIDQGADDTTNAVSIRKFFERTAGIATTTHTSDATIIQTRHRIPETPLQEGQILVYQVPIPEPLRFLEPRETETRRQHALEDYGIMHVKLYEDIARYQHIATTYAYPVRVDGRYIMDPSPTPKFDNPKMHMSPALQLFGAGREKRIYAVPPYTDVVSLDFEDHPFEPTKFDRGCALCGSEGVYLDEVVTDDRGGRMFVCSDTDFCASHRDDGGQQISGLRHEAQR